jgi:dienelactone hydrolase
MRFLAAAFAVPFAAVALLGAAPAPAQAPAPLVASQPPLFDESREPTACIRPASAGGAATTLLVGTRGNTPLSSVLVAPAAPLKNAPAVLWVHWLGEVTTTNHTEFASDAQALAERGVVSMLVDMPWSQPKWFTDVRTPERDYADTVAQVVSLRRALDCLSGIAGVDPSRIAYVGHDFGAMDGALLLAVDPRPAYAVLMTPTLSFWEWYLLGKQPADPGAYVARMAAFDLPGWLARGKQKATLLQFGQNDEYVSQATGIALRNAVPDRDRTFKAYRLDHALDDVTAHDDRVSWLASHLGV